MSADSNEASVQSVVVPLIAVANTDRELWRERAEDYYSDSIHVTESGGIGINVGGHVLVAPVRRWHEAGNKLFAVDPKLPRWRWRLAMWLLSWA